MSYLALINKSLRGMASQKHITTTTIPKMPDNSKPNILYTFSHYYSDFLPRKQLLD